VSPTEVLEFSLLGMADEGTDAVPEPAPPAEAAPKRTWQERRTEACLLPPAAAAGCLVSGASNRAVHEERPTLETFFCNASTVRAFSAASCVFRP